MILKCNSFVVRVDEQDALESMGLKTDNLEETLCPYYLDLEDVSTVRASLDDDGIPNSNSYVLTKGAYEEVRVDVSHERLVKLVWLDQGIKIIEA